MTACRDMRYALRRPLHGLLSFGEGATLMAEMFTVRSIVPFLQLQLSSLFEGLVVIYIMLMSLLLD